MVYDEYLILLLLAVLLPLHLSFFLILPICVDHNLGWPKALFTVYIIMLIYSQLKHIVN